MKVLVVAPSLRTRGGITSVVRLHMQTTTWMHMNCQHLATHEDGSALRKMWVAARSYLQAPLKMVQADVVHLHLAGELSLLRKLPFTLMARLLRKPYIAHVHASGPESLFDRTPKWATRMVLEQADRTVALSESWADAIRHHVPEAKVEVIPNPVRSFPVSKSVGQKTVLFAGKLESRKGYRTLLEAVPAILKSQHTVRFIFAGHGETAEAERIADVLGIASSVEILGWVSQLEMDLLYRNASVFCLPSRNEGVPMSVLEAMSHGVPVVCTPVGGLPEIIHDGKNGIFAVVDNVTSLANGILTLLNDLNYAVQVGEAGRNTVNAFCSLEEVDRRLSTLYNAIHSQHAGAGSRVEQIS